MNGALVIDKPSGPSSHDVVARVRRALAVKRVGHTGTLDPMATGVLPLLLGQATRLARFFAASEKAYDTRIRLGLATDTFDATGEPAPQAGRVPGGSAMPDEAAIANALAPFRGVIQQAPPAFSAKWIGGVRAYDLARRQAPVEPAPVSVTVHALDLLGVDGTAVDVRVVCSAGFYVRSLAHDLGVSLGCGAHLESIRRTRSGPFTLDQAVPLATVEAEGFGAAARLISIESLLPEVPSLTLSERGARRAAHGNAVMASDVAGPIPDAPFTRLFDGRGALIAIAEPGIGVLHPVVVLR